MARVNLVLCDLCKGSVAPEDVDKYTLAFIHEGRKDLEPAECCKTCYTSLVGRVKSDVPLEDIRAPRKTVTRQEGIDLKANTAAPSKPKKKSQPKREKPQEGEPVELFEDEVQIIKSSCDDKQRRKINSKLAKKCQHHFKSYRDGKFVCVSPPAGYQGEVGVAGCGKVLSPNEY